MNHSRLLKRLHRSRHTPGFTLVELMLAIGIFAFAISGLLALFPVALEGASATRAHTHITTIGRNLLQQIEVEASAEIELRTANATTIIASLDPTIRSTIYLGFDGEGKLVASMDASQYEDGNSSMRFLGRLDSYPLSSQQAGLPVSAPPPEDAQLTLRIEYPAAASVSNRQAESFVTRTRS